MNIPLFFSTYNCSTNVFLVITVLGSDTLITMLQQAIIFTSYTPHKYTKCCTYLQQKVYQNLHIFSLEI